MVRQFWQGRLLVGGLAMVAICGLLIAQSGASPVQAQAATTVQTKAAGALGTILTDSAGKTLYVFDRDTAGVSNCNDACAQTWPSLELATGTPSASADATGKLAVITRTDGKRQVTYQDRPLYHFASDAQPGDTKGDGVGGVWHAAKPTLALLAAAAPAAAASPAAAAPAAAAASPAAPAAAAAPTAAPATAAARPAALAATGTGGLIGAQADHGFGAVLLVGAALAMAILGMALLLTGRRPGSRA